MRSFFIVIVLATALPCSGVFAQDEPCDLNNNGFPDVADLIQLVNMVGGSDWLDSLPRYEPMFDCDCDSLHLTINDVTMLACRLIYGCDWEDGRQWWLPSDSLYIPEVEASPGDEIDIPVYINTKHSLKSLQFALGYDPEILEITDFAISDSIPGDRYLRIYAFDTGISIIVGMAMLDEDIFYEGHLGDLRIYISHDSPVDIETSIKFFNDPHRALYTGLSSRNYIYDSPDLQLFFTHPVTVDGVIRIIDSGHRDADGINSSLFGLEAYPNPFNNSVSITFELPSESDVKIEVFDLLGRDVACLYDGPMPAGRNRIVWHADGLPSGAYFCRLESEGRILARRITLLK